MIINTTPGDMQYFTSDQMNAPQMMGGSNGDMLNVLDACLIHGWGVQTVMSATLQDGVTTLAFGVFHGFLDKQVISVTGFTDGSLDGTYRATVVSPTTLSIKSPYALNVEGILTVKLAPLGWESIFGSVDTLKRAYRSLSEKPTSKVLFLDMTYPSGSGYDSSKPAKRAMLTVCEDMQVLGLPIGDMTANINNKAKNANGSLFWYQKRGGGTSRLKSAPASSKPSKWRLIGNGKVFYFVVGWSGYEGSQGNGDNTNAFSVFGFGKFADLTDGALSDTFLLAVLNDNDDNSTYIGDIGSGSTTAVYTFGLDNQLESSVRTVIKGTTSPSGTSSLYPSSYGNAIFATPYRIYTGGELRGFFYNFMYLDSSVNADTYDTKIIDDLLIMPAQSSDSLLTSDKKTVTFYMGD